MRSLTVTIPAELDRRVGPNSRLHWRPKAGLVSALRMATHHAMRAAIDLTDPVACFQTARWPLVLDVHVLLGKGKRRMDDDNAWACFKGGRDQIAACLGMDDRYFRAGTLTWDRDPEGRGAIVVTIREADGDTQ